MSPQTTAKRSLRRPGGDSRRLSEGCLRRTRRLPDRRRAVLGMWALTGAVGRRRAPLTMEGRPKNRAPRNRKPRGYLPSLHRPAGYPQKSRRDCMQLKREILRALA
jgi:hypothetical protein